MNKAKGYITVFAFACLLGYFIANPKKSEKQTLEDDTIIYTDIKEVELKKAAFSDLENWQKDNMAQSIKAFKGSCNQILKEKNEYLSNSLTKISTTSYQRICNDYLKANIKNNNELRAFIENNFVPYLVLSNNNEYGKFTSYYESALNASYTKTGKYKYPVYGVPKDLIEFNIKDFDPEATGKRYIGRIKDKKLIPYYTRKEIDTMKLNAPVILWGDDLIDIYVMQIQGSAVATLPDGSEIRVGYADNNGHPFRGIGSILLKKNLLEPGKASMGEIKKWLQKNGQLAVDNMNENKRFIFHRINTNTGPIGAHGVPLTPGRSIAVDKTYIPLGALLWLETIDPDNNKIEKLVVAQDIGGAIKGAVRGDYFWGSGKDEILDMAGRMNSSGKYYILLPKEK